MRRQRFAGRQAAGLRGVGILTALALGLALAVSAGCAAHTRNSGFLGGPDAYAKLGPGPEGGAKLRWVKPDADFGKYNRFMVDGVIFFVGEDSEYKGIDPQEMKELADKFNNAIVTAFKDKWPIVTEPGPDVARIRIAITNVKPSKPGVSAVTSVIPISLGVSLVKKGAGRGWSGSGETGIEAMTLDSTTNEVLLMAVDQRSAEFEHRFSKWGSAEDAFTFWSERMVALIDQTHGVTREPAK